MRTNRFWTCALLLLSLPISGARALDQASVPPKFPIPWGNSAGSAYIRSIPTPSQVGVQNCAASLTDGFPPLTFVPATAGGCPPFGQDLNGILKQLSQWNRWGAAGGPVYYDSAFSAAIGGYPKGAVLQSSYVPGNRWLSTIDNNLANPDTSTGGEWVQDPSQIQTGTPVQSLSATVPAGYVAANGLTIGSATGTAAQGLQVFALYRYVWNNCPNAQCPILTSGGSPTTRGVSADADYAANKGLTLYSLKGTGLIGADTMGGSSTTLLSGVPVVSGGTTVPGSIVGENLHALTAAENGTHAHTLNDPGHIHPNFLTDPGHTHPNTLTDPHHSHGNTLTDPGHTHAVSGDPNAVNGIAANVPGALDFTAGTRASRLVTSAIVLGSAFTGITISNASAATGLSINNASIGTGITISNASIGTGLSMNNSGSGTAHNNVERSTIVFWNLKL